MFAKIIVRTVNMVRMLGGVKYELLHGTEEDFRYKARQRVSFDLTVHQETLILML